MVTQGAAASWNPSTSRELEGKCHHGWTAQRRCVVCKGEDNPSDHFNTSMKQECKPETSILPSHHWRANIQSGDGSRVWGRPSLLDGRCGRFLASVRREGNMASCIDTRKGWISFNRAWKVTSGSDPWRRPGKGAWVPHLATDGIRRVTNVGDVRPTQWILGNYKEIWGATSVRPALKNREQKEAEGRNRRKFISYTMGWQAWNQ